MWSFGGKIKSISTVPTSTRSCPQSLACYRMQGTSIPLIQTLNLPYSSRWMYGSCKTGWTSTTRIKLAKHRPCKQVQGTLTFPTPQLSQTAGPLLATLAKITYMPETQHGWWYPNLPHVKRVTFAKSPFLDIYVRFPGRIQLVHFWYLEVKHQFSRYFTASSFIGIHGFCFSCRMYRSIKRHIYN